MGWRAVALLVVLCFGAGATGCKAAQGEDCKYNTECTGELVCFESRCTDRAGATLSCGAREACASVGHCTASTGNEDAEASICVAEREQDCLGSQNCRKIGRCAPQRDNCRALSDEHCRNAETCHALGHCAARDGECRAANDGHCQASEVCKVAGSCKALDGACVGGG
jgi:hypothetical protein